MKKITILLFTAAAMASACKKFTGINNNPNQPTAVTPNVVLSAALAASGSSLAGDFILQTRWIGYWSRSGNYIADNQTEGYGINTGYADGSFQDLYSTLSKYNYIEKTALTSPSALAFYAGVAKTMKALHFSTLVDGFGNVPYSQAFNVNKYPTPAYDDAATIYGNLLTQLDSAVIYFNKAKIYYATAPGTVISTDDKYDIMFGRGKGVDPTARMNSWIAFANTVRLKLLMNEQAAVGASVITAEIAKITANGGGYLMAGMSASVNPVYTSAQQAQLNPFYGIFFTNGGSTTTNNNYYRANTYAVNFYNSTNDTYRPALFYAALGNGTIGSNYDGDPNSVSNSFTSGIGPGLLKSPGQDELILSDFESLFIQAEAAARGFNVGNAAALLKSAVEQNFIYLGDNAADADTYLLANAGNSNVDYAEGGLQAVITQKWAALNGINWFQAYTDYRRTGFPVSDVLGVSHANQHVQHNGKVYIPYRFLYPQSEYDTNGKNVPTLSQAQYTPIFWDKREN
jgi:hypothetical protein